MLFDRADLERAVGLVRDVVPPTPAYSWPLLAERFGCEVVVKHENMTPTGAFKVRGGLVFLERLARAGAPHVVSATRGNHGQSIALAARRYGGRATIFAPETNSTEKNAAMRGFGAELVLVGRDFDEARLAGRAFAEDIGATWVPSYHRDLVLGVATYALELFQAAADLDVVYVPIGCGSGICGLITVRDLLGLKTEIVGVVADGADGAAQSVEQGRLVETSQARTFADGMAVRTPVQEAFDIYSKGAARVVRVSDAEIAEAMRILWKATHNASEGAGAAALAALAKEAERLRGRKAGVILCGQNVDASVFTTVLQGGVPAPF